MPSELPTARVERAAGGGWTRLLPFLGLALAVFLLRAAWAERGPLLTLRATEGYGLRPGDALRFRGIEVGEVESVALESGAARVRIEIRLSRTASDLARVGSRFWIARPVLGVEGVRGLETALGVRYVAVLPGPPEGEPTREFVALEDPPLFESEDPEALEIVLLAEERAGLARGAPLLYRGIPIGSLVSVGLASDASVVEVRARVHGSHAELVRADSRFYRTRGAQLSLGLGGLELAVDSFQSLWLGGVAVATPTHSGPRAVTGQRFELAAEPEDDWLAWRPALPVGLSESPLDAPLPERRWGRLTWKPSRWFSRKRTRGGWLVRVGKNWLGPADLLVPPEEAESVFLELEGERLELSAAPNWTGMGLALRELPAVADAGPLPPRRALSEPEDLLLYGDPGQAPMAIDGAYLEREAESWRLSTGLALDDLWHGALVLARADGRIVGILLVVDGLGRIVGLPPE